ncbi:MAG: molybdenum cofactor guanylyltransferase [Syntrophobacterales bacterium]|nr:molybdenum cofactor guanylyltransferase [Syntrophobacterales bacterium]
MEQKMTGVILAGGKSSRMGTNKAFLKIAEERLIDRNIRLLRNIFKDVLIVVSNPQEYLLKEATIVTDIVPGKGALGGIYTGLFFAPDKYAFVMACDMPFLNISFVEYMAEKAKGCDIVVPSPPDGLQPLCAVYSRACLPAIKNLLDKNRLQIKNFYPGHKVLEIPAATLSSFDPQGNMFTNLNTPEDFAAFAQSGLSEAG